MATLPEGVGIDIQTDLQNFKDMQVGPDDVKEMKSVDIQSREVVNDIDTNTINSNSEVIENVYSHEYKPDRPEHKEVGVGAKSFEIANDILSYSYSPNVNNKIPSDINEEKQGSKKFVVADKTLFRRILDEHVRAVLNIGGEMSEGKKQSKMVDYTGKRYLLSKHVKDVTMPQDIINEREELIKKVHNEVSKNEIKPSENYNSYKLNDVELKFKMDGDGLEFNMQDIVDKRATCCISIPRVGKDGNKIEAYDVIEFKDGKMTDYLFSSQGKSQLSKKQQEELFQLDKSQLKGERKNVLDDDSKWSNPNEGKATPTWQNKLKNGSSSYLNH
ncbi:hypothetical protein [Candidatus Bandiella euplotis]|uniref:Uncharacterized protein n=1 Tax=Candidatus Bandiella euplotis TaxID=1664265 RepID=A0ABZ0URR2_9RICK|nr:hypothetical protein [Candidatus Bandiella woodruffii]WPX96725.1 hypothetical protein Bandiella_00849 [Candidatus Bandiella woodruffii]